MVTVYKVTGMTCDGCRQSVEQNLRTLTDVISVEVDLESSTARIESSEPKALEYFQEALGSKYKIFKTKSADIHDISVPHKDATQSEIRQLFPLFLIFAYLFSAAILLNYQNWDTGQFMLDFMGLFYIVFSFFKFLDLKGFPGSFAMYDPLARVFPVYGYCYPFIELALGLLFLMRVQVFWALVVTLVILGITTVGVLDSLISKRRIRCACLGTALNLPMTKATLIENSIMLLMAAAMLLFNF